MLRLVPTTLGSPFLGWAPHRGKAWQGAAAAGLGSACPGTASLTRARCGLSWHVLACLGWARKGITPLGRSGRGMARLGATRRGMAYRCEARRVAAGRWHRMSRLHISAGVLS